MIGRSSLRTSSVIEQGWTCPACQIRQLKFGSPASWNARSAKKRYLLHETNEFLASRRQFATTSPSYSGPIRSPRLPDHPARTRFAPSPTGYLHIGGLRTALFSFLLAKRTGGQFLLRIEDTDQKRLVHDAEARLYEDLQWAGLQWDEGPTVGGAYGPYRQSERNQIYGNYAQQLVEDGAAYRCFCEPQKQRSAAAEAVYVTSGCYQNCSALALNESRQRADMGGDAFTVRLREPSPSVLQKRVYSDIVYGKIKRLKRSPAAPQTASDDEGSGIDASDPILLKSDGTPTYHFANVVDDHSMKITHVIRGAEWMASTPLHYDIYAAFGWQPPSFTHVGLLVDENKAKLSKRNTSDMALDVRSLREDYGVLPQTLNNFLALLGWSHGQKSDIMDMDELVKHFDLKFTKGNTMVKMEKLWYLQKQHMARLCANAMVSYPAAAPFNALKPVLSDITAEVRRRFSLERLRINTDLAFSNEDGEIFSDRLEAYCTLILFADGGKNYASATQWVERNRHFFSFEPAHNLDQSPGTGNYDKAGNIAGDMLQAAAMQVLSACPDLISYQHSERMLDFVHNLERTINTAIKRESWELAWRYDQCYPVCDPPEVIPQTPMNGEANEFIRLQPVPGDQHAIVSFARSLCGGSAPEEIVAGLVKRYNVFHSALMKFLRKRLMHGAPGPNMASVMALLGWRECSRRLGLELDPDRNPKTYADPETAEV